MSHNSTPSANDKKIRLLIVDDHPVVIGGIEKGLAEIDDITLIGSASNEKTAIEKVEKDHPDVVLLDLILNGTENGLDIARTILAKHPEIYVIIFTQDRNNTKNTLELCLQFGVHGYLLKDNPVYEVISAIRAVCDGKTWIDPTISANLIISKKSTQEITEALSLREIEILLLLKEALSNEELAEKLTIAKSTVARHLTNIYGKIGVRSRAEAVKWLDNSSLDK